MESTKERSRIAFEMRDAGYQFTEIGPLLGVSASRARQLCFMHLRWGHDWRESIRPLARNKVKA